MLELVHFLHIASGTAWAGAALAFAFVVEPALARLEPQAARAYLERQAPFAGRLMSVSGLLLIATGLLRSHLGGGILAPSDLVSSYGLHVLVSLALVLAVTAHGGWHRGRVVRLMAEGGDHRPALARLQRRHALVTGGGILATLVIMTILGLGLS